MVGGIISFTVTVADAVPVQPFASVMVTVYVPALSMERSSFVEPVVHIYVYGTVPPEGVRFTVPVPLLHGIDDPVAVADKGAAGCVTTTVPDVVQPFASVTVTT